MGSIDAAKDKTKSVGWIGPKKEYGSAVARF